MWRNLLFITFLIGAGKANDCVPRSFGNNKIVCVCNATYCDSLSAEDTKVPDAGKCNWYVSNKDGLRLKKSEVSFGTSKHSLFDVTLTVDSTKKYQTILGFGGAFTDSFGINVKKLSEATQKQLIRSYYDPKVGSRYTIGRIPIGGTDFSTRNYTYDDVAGDVTLEHFALTDEDHDYKIPLMKQAVELNEQVLFFGSSWSAPPWMKTNDAINGFGFLKRKYYKVYADYILKFLEAYKEEGVNVWAVTTGNEPFDVWMPFVTLNSMGWTPSTVATWVADYLGPTLANSQYNDTLILLVDDNRFQFPWFPLQTFQNENAKNYIAGTAVHWYADSFISPKVLDQTHDGSPDKFILLTEASIVHLTQGNPAVHLGSWVRGQQYILNIIENLNHWVIGWVDWNLALDKDGGPNWINNTVDSAIIVNPESDEFYKQPMYYAIQHFSKFIDSGSVRIDITDHITIKATAALTPSGEVVVVLYNNNFLSTNVILKDLQVGNLSLKLSPFSMNTIVYRVK